MLVKAHTSFIGETGYNCHSRNFFKALHRITPVQIRNFTVGSTWSGYDNDEPHNKEYYMDDVLKTMMVEQTLNTPNGREEFPLYTSYKNEGKPDINIVLNETNHHYFYDSYDGIKIAYNVWETTRYQDDFFDRLKTFDQVWVPTKWQKDCTVEQGIPEWKVKVVPEGVDVKTYKPKNYVVSKPVNRPFRFILVGRWDYRKATKEIIETFVNTFSENDNVELLINVDNPFAYDGMNSTEERLEKYGIKHSGIKVLHHLSKSDYVEMIKSADVFLSCARGEGWNLPLIEAMSSGIPSIYSNWGGQLEFAAGRGIPVDIIGEVPANVQGNDNYFSWTKDAPGKFAEPDFKNLSKKMRDVVDNYVVYKKKALDESDEIREIFTWENAAIIANDILKELTDTSMYEDSVAIVLAHPNTPRKKELLKECLSSIKMDIILSANHPIDEETQKMSDWVIFSKENPILFRKDFEKYGVDYYMWYALENGERLTVPFEYEHGYAAYLLTKNGIELARKIGKKKVHIINYDYEISPTTIKHNEKLLEEYDIVLYRHAEWDYDTKTFCSAFFSSRIEPAESYFTKYKSKDEYYRSMTGFNILEINMFEHFDKSPYKKYTEPLDNLRIGNKINQESADNTTKFELAQKDNSKNEVKINFVDQPFVEITGKDDKEYFVNFIDKDENKTIFSSKIKTNHWTRCNRKWFTNWRVEIKSSDGDTFVHDFDLSGKRVFIVFESSSLGDTIAWIPYVEEFRKKHNCQVIVSTFQNKLFASEYPNIEFVEPGTSVHNLYALYRVGVFYDDNGVNWDCHKTDFRNLRLQEYITDILGLDFKEIRPNVKPIHPFKTEKPYICIANHSTAQPKYWNNPTGWQELVDYVKELGYDVYLLSKEEDGYMGNKNPSGVVKIENKTLEEIGSILLGSEGFIGLGSGLSWYAWGLGVPTMIISGFSEPYQEMTDGIYRIINKEVCTGCFARHLFDKGDWNWCPDHKGTPRQFECTKEITFDMVKPSLNQMLGI